MYLLEIANVGTKASNASYMNIDDFVFICFIPSAATPLQILNLEWFPYYIFISSWYSS